MSRLYITEHGAKIGYSGNQFVIEKNGIRIKTVPGKTLDSIQIHSKAQMSEQCIEKCLRADIPVAFYSGGGQYLGSLMRDGMENAKRQKEQISFAESPESISLARVIIHAKLSNQIAILRRYRKKRDPIGIDESIRMIGYFRKKVRNGSQVSQIMGYEGIASREYFKALGGFLKPELEFSTRSRRPARDEFNAILNIGYSMLYNEFCGQIVSDHLNPYFGFMHKDRTGHASLASDLMEEWRPVIVDALSMSLIKGHEIRSDHFMYDDKGGCYLTKEGRTKVIRKYDEKISCVTKYLGYQKKPVPYRQAISLQIEHYVRIIQGGGADIYEPILIR